MRFTIVTLFLLAVGAQAAEKAEPFVNRGRVHFDSAASIYRKANGTNGAAERHKLYGLARVDIQRARELARKAERVADDGNRAAVHAFVRQVRELAEGIETARARYSAPTDIIVQRTLQYRPNATIERQAAQLERNTAARERAAATPANIRREQERERLQKWRLARIAERLKNGKQ